MGKYTDDSRQLLELVGGRENIAAVSHCMTRMRFVLNDPKKADVEKIEALKSVKGSFTQAGQFQVIIGNDVAVFYNDFTAAAGIEGVSKDAVKQAAKKNQNPLQRAVAVLAEIFAPLIPAIITGGLILGFRNCIDSLYLFENGTKTLCDLSQFWAGVDSFLWLIGEAVFHVGIPVGICWSVAKKMGTTEMLGIVLGLTLVSSQLLNAYSVAGTAAADIPQWNFGFFKVNMIGYQAQVIPAMLAAFTLAYLERFFKRIVPQAISMIVVPFCSLLLAVIAAHWILGPIGWKIGSAVSSVVYAGITGSFKVVFAAIFGFVYAPLVITGLHHMSNAIDLQLIADYKGTMLWPMIALSNIAQGSAVLAMIRLQKKNTRAQEVNVPACISCYLGVTEPAIFGVNLKYTFPFVCGMAGSAVAAMISVGTGSTANAVGVGGLPGILSMQVGSMPTFAIAMAAAIVIPFILTMIVGQRKLSREDRGLAAAVSGNGSSDRAAEANAAGAGRSNTEGKKTEINKTEVGNHAGTNNTEANNAKAENTEAKNTEGNGTGAGAADGLVAYLSGKVIPIEEVGDGVFSAKILGDGIAIEPESDTVVAPAKVTVSVLMQDSKHAAGLVMEDGREILIHVGLDTVQMNGDGFEYLVNQGDVVEAGTPIIRFDREKIKAAGKRDVTIMAVTDGTGQGTISYLTGMKAEAGKTAVAKIEK